MGAARYTPWEFVLYLHSLKATAGQIPLKQYMSKTHKNGGNDSATELFKNLRWLHDGGLESAPRLNEIVGKNPMEHVVKGQGSGESFIKIWNFMCRNRDLLKKYKVKVYARRAKKDPETMIFIKEGTVFDMYFKNNSDQAALELMIEDHFFGIDCIGFTGQFLVYTGEWSGYTGTEPDLWPNHHCKTSINSAKDIRALDFLVWVSGGHIAIVDEVFDMMDEVTVRLDVCQCSSGEARGPQLNQWVQLKETNVPISQGRKQFKIQHKGSPAMPVDSPVYVFRRETMYF